MEATYPRDTLKLNVQIQMWLYYSLSNNLAIVFDTQSQNNNDEDVLCLNHQEDESGSLKWLMLTINDYSLYLTIMFIL